MKSTKLSYFLLIFISTISLNSFAFNNSLDNNVIPMDIESKKVYENYQITDIQSDNTMYTDGSINDNHSNTFFIGNFIASNTQRKINNISFTITNSHLIGTINTSNENPTFINSNIMTGTLSFNKKQHVFFGQEYYKITYIIQQGKILKASIQNNN